MSFRDYFSLQTTPVMIAPTAGILLGGFIGRFISPSLKTLVILRNIAAGLVLAAVSTELAPEISDAKGYVNRLSVLAGMVLGLGMMILIRTIFSQEQEDKMSLEVVISIAIDFFIDSVLIGIALRALSGGNSSYILAISLGVEMFILSMTTTSQMHLANSSLLYIVGAISIFVFSAVSGLATGMILSDKLKGGSAFYAMIAFGVSALVWLVLEDLFTKSKYLDSRIGAVMLFIGYMSVIIMGWFS